MWTGPRKRSGCASAYVPLTKRLTEALRQARHLRGPRVVREGDGQPLTQKVVQGMMRRAARRANVKPGVHILRHHVLFASGDAWRAREGDPGTGRTPGPGHDAALHALESGGARCRDSVARNGNGIPWRNTGGGGKTGRKEINPQSGWLPQHDGPQQPAFRAVVVDNEIQAVAIRESPWRLEISNGNCGEALVGMSSARLRRPATRRIKRITNWRR